MESGFIALLIMVAAIATALGVLLGKCVNKTNTNSSETQGAIHVVYDTSTDEPLLYLNPEVPITDIVSRKRVAFDVIVTRQNSHK